MANEKLQGSAEKPGDTIPAPVIAAQSPSSRGSRFWTIILRHCIPATLLLVVLHRWTDNLVKENLAATEGLWIAKAFGDSHRPGTKSFPRSAKAAEKLFLTIPNPGSAIAASRQYATKPHMAGTPGDFDTATDFLALLQTELGIIAPATLPVFPAGSAASRNATLAITSQSAPSAWIDQYYPVMNTPLDRSLAILEDDGSTAWAAELEEAADETDPDAGQYAEAVPAWHGLSRGGEAKGRLVYANYGRKQDYDALVADGVDLNGTIVITRYGGIFRGLKVKGAEELGAAAVLIYNDPRDDGTVTVENGYVPYPSGPARNPTSLQRGSVQYLSMYPGDPTTPGYPSYENSTRTEGLNIPKIPSLPISWANAQVLLDELKSGGKNRTVSMINHVDDRVIPIWNTMGVIPGHIKDEVVVLGNHRDAWVMGASDPSSGTVSVHEVVRGLGVLLQLGWKPLRTIVIASWDAEEYGLIGSTEWGEDFADWIEEHVVAYLNLDSSVSGSRFRLSGSPSFAHFLRGIAEELPHPTKPGLTLWDASKDSGVLYGEHLDTEAAEVFAEQEQLRTADSLGVSVLGSGSDYTVFLQRIGVASTNNGFGSTLSDPVYHYHSVYDSQRWQELYADPGFLRHVAVAKFLGLQTLRLADAIVLPLNTTHYATQLEGTWTGAYRYLPPQSLTPAQRIPQREQLASTTSLDLDFTSLHESLHALRAASEALDAEKTNAEHTLRRLLRRLAKHALIKRKLRRMLCSLKRVFGIECGPGGASHHRAHPPAAQGAAWRAVKPRIGRAPARAAEQRAREGRSAGKCGLRDSGARGELEGHGGPSRRIAEAVRRVRAVNRKLVAFERGLIHGDGIKDREWYRHLGVAPGKWLGYGATTLPALTESITLERNATMAKYEAGRLKALMDKLAVELRP
ncbi:Zn-dependent exopeptidase [Amylocystis lapponica]|nr:Zn-dependent exopeptidase [Amylocystis lapponica]